MLRIGELSALTGVGPRLLRYYQSRGLLAADRSASGQRLFDPAAVERVRAIRSLLGVGLPTRTILELIDCVSEPGRLEPCATPVLVEHLKAYDARIADLVSTREGLEALINSGPDARHPARAEGKAPCEALPGLFG
ncbi:MerR family transcriptional regulator [Cryobacterium sp. TMT1-3]|uniref:MerR family transcriptional regulator n=2 Tax=Cryobacterium luteum TaxID=1424661 RepID=A0A5F0CZA6_9MICO|nr:MerR family transcriptional regulator [Cryobacterium luteum]TFC31405.1 MerR family transcriptional regulator [Cryobacterium sp. TMT1-3]